MDLSEREELQSSDHDGDNEYSKVSKRIENVTLESDSLPESPSNTEERIARRKKRIRKQKGATMDVDPSPNSSASKRFHSKYMECGGDESHISSSDDSSGDNKGGEADDEQSDWISDVTTNGENTCESAPFDRKLFLRKSATSSSLSISAIQRKIERFSRDGSRGELTLDVRSRDRAISSLLNRYLFKYQLEIVRRYRGSVVLRKKNDQQHFVR